MKASEVKRGNVVEYNGKVYQVRDVDRSSPTARGGNVTFRFTLYSVPGAQKLDISMRAEDDLKETELTRRAANFVTAKSMCAISSGLTISRNSSAA